MKLNINDKVHVKLTDYGRRKLKEDHEKFFSGNLDKFPHRPKEEDENGWSEWQLWSLMHDLGPYLVLGFEPPFEPEIEIMESRA